MPGAKSTSFGADKSPRIFLVCSVPQLRRVRAMRELQHFHDPSQAAQSPRMPLLWIAEADTEAVPQVPIEIHVFFWRRFRTFGGAPAQGISRRAHCPARSRYSAPHA